MDPSLHVERLYKTLSGKMIASLTSYFGLSHIAIAEDLVQDTFSAALISWKEKGLPNDPAAWLFKTCKNKALNHLRQKDQQHLRLAEIGHKGHEAKLDHIFLDHEIQDSQLGLLFACCHASLAPRNQVIIILKYLGGLRVESIARALSMQEEAVMKSISRSRNTLEAQQAFNIPSLPLAHERLNSVLMAIYLLFSEGYSTTEGDSQIKKELCIESMRLMRALLGVPQFCIPDTFALMALMCFHASRFESREDSANNIIALEDQDRTKWDVELIKLGTHYFTKTYNAEPSRFIIEAAIAAQHCNAKNFRDTNWDVIRKLYDKLYHFNPSPFTELNKVIAEYFRTGKTEALQILDTTPHLHWLNHYYLYHAFLGKLYAESHEINKAIKHYAKAITLTKQRAERIFLEKKLQSLQTRILNIYLTSIANTSVYVFEPFCI